ncbi:uncharacterized protein LOC144180156 [Haemaphysalis longicornis]
MVGSEGAAIAADAGRGVPSFAVPKDYRIVLPPLPTGEAMSRAVVLHCDNRDCRPYRIDDFRQPLKDFGVIQEVGGIGAYQMSHVWLVNFRSDDAKKKLLEAGRLDVKGHTCLVIDPNKQELRVKLHWVSFDVSNEAIRRAFAVYGEVKDVASDRWRAADFETADSTTRVLRLVLREVVTPECLPHQVPLGKGKALVVVPGRAPVCLRCRTAGHIRRECRVPKCTECHAFGHEQADCTRTYARAVGRGADADRDELLMDEEEAETAATPEEDGNAVKDVVSDFAEKPSEGNSTQEGLGEELTKEAMVPEANPSTSETALAASPAVATESGSKKDDEATVRGSSVVKMNLQEGSAKRGRECVDDAPKAQRLRQLEQQWKYVGKKKSCRQRAACVTSYERQHTQVLI